MNEAKFVDVAGIKTRYVEQGEGEPVVLVHGGQFSSLYSLDSFELNIPGLAERYHVYAFDKLGQGFTDGPKTEDGYTMDATVQHAYQFLRTMGIERAHLVGHSRGAYLVLRLTMEHPELAKSLVILDSNSILSGGRQTPFYQRLEAISPPWGTREMVILEPTENAFSGRHVTEDWIQAMMEAAALPKSQEVRDKFRAVRDSVYFPAFGKQKDETIAWVNGGGVKAPVLIIWGYNDPSAPLEDFGWPTLHLFARTQPRTQMCIFNEAGHYVFREQWQGVNTAITTFLEALRDEEAGRPDGSVRQATEGPLS